MRACVFGKHVSVQVRASMCAYAEAGADTGCRLLLISTSLPLDSSVFEPEALTGLTVRSPEPLGATVSVPPQPVLGLQDLVVVMPGFLHGG